MNLIQNIHGFTYCLLQTRPLYPLQKDDTEQQHVIFQMMYIEKDNKIILNTHN